MERAGDLYFGDALQCYEGWPAPACIISDGPYGLGKYPGEPGDADQLAAWYEPHVAAWAAKAQPETTLWFWNSELGWAQTHRVLDRYDWEYQEACVWDKGLAHVAGNCNSKTLRGFPVVTELAVRYVRRTRLIAADGSALTIKAWVRAEWQRSGLPLSRANEAAGVRNAATRKYLTEDHLWYFPPADAIVAMARYCAQHGATTMRPYFSLDGSRPITASAWERLRATWNYKHAVTNVWHEPPVHGSERVKLRGTAYLHANQKPLRLMQLQIDASSRQGDVVWEPFGGLCSASLAAHRLGRRGFAAEINPDYFRVASARLEAAAQEPSWILSTCS